MSGPRTTLISNLWAEDLGGEPAWIGGKGRGRRRRLSCTVRGRSAESGGSEPIATRNPRLTVATDPCTGGIAPARGEEGFLGGKPPKGAHRRNWRSSVALITGGRRAITCEAYTSHGCYTFCVEKGNGGTHIRAKNMYIKGSNHYLWWGKDPTGRPTGMSNNPGVAGNPNPVWQPGFQPCCQVLSVTRMKSAPGNFVRSNEATGNQVYH